MNVFCPVLLSGKYIPSKFAHKETRRGMNASLPISWGDVPHGTKSFALSIINHAPTAHNAVHWIVVNIPANSRGIPENASLLGKIPPDGMELRNSFGESDYYGPMPSRGADKYEIKVYALHTEHLQVGPSSTYDQFLADIDGKVLATASLVAVFTE